MTIVNLMEVSNINVFQSETIVHILFDYPQVKSICKKVIIFSVAHNNPILLLKNDTVVECSDKIMAVTDFSTTGYAPLCKLASHNTYSSGIHAACPVSHSGEQL